MRVTSDKFSTASIPSIFLGYDNAVAGHSHIVQTLDNNKVIITRDITFPLLEIQSVAPPEPAAPVVPILYESPKVNNDVVVPNTLSPIYHLSEHQHNQELPSSNTRISSIKAHRHKFYWFLFI